MITLVTYIALASVVALFALPLVDRARLHAWIDHVEQSETLRVEMRTPVTKWAVNLEMDLTRLSTIRATDTGSHVYATVADLDTGAKIARVVRSAVRDIRDHVDYALALEVLRQVASVALDYKIQGSRVRVFYAGA